MLFEVDEAIERVRAGKTWTELFLCSSSRGSISSVTPTYKVFVRPDIR